MSGKKTGEERRRQILDYLSRENRPLSGAELAKRLQVSRQVIVQDIALLRAIDKNILSTNLGYVLYCQSEGYGKFSRSFQVLHEDEDILDELSGIVGLGGKVLDVAVEHEIYGRLAVDMVITTRPDAEILSARLKEGRMRPLKDLTGGIHSHTVEAASAKILDEIEECLKEKGFLF